MFCSNHAPHESSYEVASGKRSRSQRGVSTNSSNRTRARRSVGANSSISEDPSLALLTKDVWSSLRHSEFYERDYKLFQVPSLLPSLPPADAMSCDVM